MSPIRQSSGSRDVLIRRRDSLLNYLSGASKSLVINHQPVEVAMSPPTDLVDHLRNTLLDLKASFMNANGDSVDYTALKNSTAYADYQQTCQAALQAFDPQTLPSLAASQAFWINLYNTLVLDAVIHFNIQESVIEGRLGILAFFRRVAYQVGGQRVSLDDIEQGILRANRGNPYIPGPCFTSADPRLAWVLPIDPRIHFALNCGGRSCPPIRVYTPEKLEQQLDLVSRGFIDATVSVQPAHDDVVLSQIFRWYAVDFGGSKGIRQFLLDYLPHDERPQWLLSSGNSVRFCYAPYNWHLNAS